MRSIQTGKSDKLLLKGSQFLLGSRVREDLAKARSLILRAAELDNPDALFLAHMILADGLGGPFDRTKAFGFLQRGVELGSLEATYCLGFSYLNGGLGNIGYSDEVVKQQLLPVDEKKGLALLEAAASQGHALAVLRIAEYWESRAEVDPAMLGRALKWYKKGVALGEPNCMIHFADFLILGKALPKDRKKARILYLAAKKSGDICAKRTARERLKESAIR
jgi:TPR repeat protein